MCVKSRIGRVKFRYVPLCRGGRGPGTNWLMHNLASPTVCDLGEVRTIAKISPVIWTIEAIVVCDAYGIPKSKYSQLLIGYI